MHTRIVIFGMLVLSLWPQGICAQSQALLSRELKKLNSDFTYHGKPVHPRAIKDLTSWVADSLPGPIAVDVAGTFDSNRYFGDYKVQEDGRVFVDLKQDYLDDIGWFAYRRIGRLANGLHVVRTYDNGGGTGVFQSLLLIECLIEFEYRDDGRRKSILVMRRRGEFGLGDRYSGKISIDSRQNRITAAPDGRNLEKPLTIQIRN